MSLAFRLPHKVVAVFAVLLFLTGCGTVPASQAAPTAQPSVPKTPAVVSTDMAWDDIAALVYLLRRPDVDVRAITVAGDGETHCTPGVAHVRQLVAYLGHAPVSVACGRQQPLSGSAAFPAAWRQAADAFYGLSLPSVTEPESNETASQLLARVLLASPGAVVISLGPMTDLAETLTLYPNLKTRINMIDAMGGAFDVPGNEITNNRAEWNVYVDPSAAQTVLRSGVPVTLVPLDASDDVPVTTLFRDALNTRPTNAASKLLSRLFSDPYFYTGGQYFWDPAAVTVATDPGVARLSTEWVTILQEPGQDQGRTVRAAGGSPVRAAVGINAQAFYQQYLRTVTGDPHFAVTLPSSRLDVSYSAGRWWVVSAVRSTVGETALTVTNDSSFDAGVVVAKITDGHTVADVDKAIAAHATSAPSWFQIVLQVTVPQHHPATWGIDLDRGLYVIVGGGETLALQRLASVTVR